MILGCAIGCVGLAIRSIEGCHLEGSAGYRDALTVGNDVRNFQRPLISESGADKKTWIFGSAAGTSTLAGALAAAGALPAQVPSLGLPRATAGKLTTTYPAFPPR